MIKSRFFSGPFMFGTFLFGSTVFLASFLLFLIEPIAAKQLLPTFGGSSAVWITCLVFFQTALLCGYLYAHWLATRSRQTAHFVFLGVAAIAAISAATWQVTGSVPSGADLAVSHPALAIFAALAVSIGFPFLMLGATSPLLQVWFARLETTAVPYRFYALSNLASLLALAAYPTLIEPYFTLKTQWLAWSCGFVIFVFFSALLAWRTRSTTHACLTNSEAMGYSKETSDPAETRSSGTTDTSVTTGILGATDNSRARDRHDPPFEPATTVGSKILWILLPLAASMQLSAITNHLTQNIAAIPLLWILPLGVYLITLVFAFQFPRLVPRSIMTRLLIFMLAALSYMLTQIEGSWPLKMVVAFFLIELLVSCYFCHSEACALKPVRASETTLFYLFFAAGSALGSFLIGILSPLLFSFNYDLAISFLVTALVALGAAWKTGWGQRLLWASISILMVVLVFFLRTAYHRDTQVAVRNFYGSLRVKQTIGYPPATVRTLSNGTIQHGSQIFSAELIHTPTTYYAEDSGIGIALRSCCRDGSGQPGPRRIGVIGLGVGTIAAYGQPEDQIRFYEINPAVVPIAKQVFAYIRNSSARTTIVEGDARNSLAAEEPQRFDVLAIDAFSGDAIPLHLLTSQAVDLYKRHLAPGGILAFHISNQHVDLEPEIALLAENAGMTAMRFSSPINEQRGEFSATWMLVSASPTFFDQPDVAAQGKRPELNPKVRLWTDDYSSLLPILHW